MKLRHLASGVYEVVASNGERILIKGARDGESIREINPHSYAELLRTIAKDYERGWFGQGPSKYNLEHAKILRANADKLDSIQTLKSRTRRG